MRKHLPGPLLNLGMLLLSTLVLLLGIWGVVRFRANLATGQSLVRAEALRVSLRDRSLSLHAQILALLKGEQAPSKTPIEKLRAAVRSDLAALLELIPQAPRAELGTELETLQHRIETSQELCLELFAAGRPVDARRVLEHSGHQKLIQALGLNLEAMDTQLRQTKRDNLDSQERDLGLLIGFLGLILFTVIYGWFSAARSLQRWRQSLAGYNRQLADQSRSLRQSNWALDQVVAERTKDLETRYEELQTAKERAEAANEAKNNFLSSMSHELKTPLTSIHSYASLLRDFCGDEDQEIRNEFLEVILIESERLGRLISDILNFSMIELGRIELQRDWVALDKILGQASDTAGSLRLQKDVELLVANPPGLELFIDADRIQQVLSNLITNAWKFSEDGQTVHLEVETQADGCLSIAVRDHGPGVPDGVKQKIFGRFQQGGDSLTGKPQGTGLGLSIAETLVDLHGGTVSCEDAEGGGARFVVRMPADSVRKVGSVTSAG